MRYARPVGSLHLRDSQEVISICEPGLKRDEGLQKDEATSAARKLRALRAELSACELPKAVMVSLREGAV